jgi:hypothetical protein
VRVAKIETNSDGSAIAKLDEPITLNGEQLTRVTICKIKGRHLMGLPVLGSMGQYLLLASRVVEPAGAIEEMSPDDAVDIGNHVMDVIAGKGKAGQNSPTGTTGSP